MKKAKYYPKNSPTHALAVKTDTGISDLSQQLQRDNNALANAKDSLRHYVGERRVRMGREYRWEKPFSQTLQAYKSGEFASWEAKNAKNAFDAYTNLLPQIANTEKQIAYLEAIFYEYQWSRFFLVVNNGGHIHSSMACSTCRAETLFSWLPSLSGLTEGDAVANQGEILCTVCFPSAPSAWTSGTSIASRVQVSKREADKAAKLAEKALTSLSIDGSTVEIQSHPIFDKKTGLQLINRATGELRFASHKELKTHRAASQWLADALYFERVIGVSGRYASEPDAYSPENVDLVFEMLAAKLGGPLRKLRADIEAKVAAKEKREAAERAKWA